MFKLKRKVNGSIDRHRIKFGAQGFKKVEGIYFNLNYSPVINYISIHMVIAMAVSKGYELRQLEVKNTFLQGELNELVFMKQPLGYEHVEFPKHVELANDLIVMGDNNEVIENIIGIICSELKCRDLVLLKSFLGIEVTQQSDGSIFLTQVRYAMDLLVNNNMSMCKPCRSPTFM